MGSQTKADNKIQLRWEVYTTLQAKYLKNSYLRALSEILATNGNCYKPK
jgi:hypothetical protein